MTNRPLRPVDDQACRLAKTIARTARFAALATLEPETGVPFASRVGVAPDLHGRPVILISSLSMHFSALDANPACSLLLGEPGKGDPLAHPRLTMVGEARRITEEGEARLVKHGYLGRHPKAALYVDFADFQFWRLETQRGFLNAGFGSAYALTQEDMVTDGFMDSVAPGYMTNLIDTLNRDRALDIEFFATEHLKQPAGRWRLAGADPEGFDLVLGHTIVRHWFDHRLADWRDLPDQLPSR